MKLLEYEAKQLLNLSKIPVPLSHIITSSDQKDIPFPLVLKSQVPTGGRGKAGGVLIVEDKETFDTSLQTLFKLPIKGFLPKTILAEEKLSIARELYISLILNRETSGLQFIAHINGGIEVEDNTDFKTWDIPYGELNPEVIGQELATYLNLEEQAFVLQDLVENLYNCFVSNDATLIEINPLVLTTDNKLIAGDCKMTLDDAAAFRHDWNFETKEAEVNFVTIDPQGTVATIANGAGLAMATVDAVYDAGLKPANFLDIGGGASTETLLKAFSRIVEYPQLKAIVINIFAGITRSDEVAKAIIAAKKEITNLPPLFIRLAGTNYETAKTLLRAENIAILPSLEDCLTAVKETIDE